MPTQDIRDVKPVESVSDPALWVILGVLAAAVSIFLLVRYFRDRPRTAKPGAFRIKSPWEQAYERLDRLAAQDLIAKKEIKKYYSELSNIVRYYFEERFHVKAPEMTTPEFLEHLGRLPHLPSSQKETLKDFLNSCDMVKFAKFVPDTDEAGRSFEFARRLIDETKPA